MEIRFEMIDDVLIPILIGELDHHSSTKIREDIDQTYKAFKAKHIILSFEELTFMDSSGIGLIMGRYNKVREENGKIAIIGCNDHILRILELAGIYTIAKCYTNLEEALADLKNREEEEV
ncbi:MAG TPA: anti-sigma F factor antagonist [Anaerovoracaceae bacterium]|nr:anti-sigma F factor antagonist [Anaerovoracaceae bacterium]